MCITSTDTQVRMIETPESEIKRWWVVKLLQGKISDTLKNSFQIDGRSRQCQLKKWFNEALKKFFDGKRNRFNIFFPLKTYRFTAPGVMSFHSVSSALVSICTMICGFSESACLSALRYNTISCG
jgi:hypothetical protein